MRRQLGMSEPPRTNHQVFMSILFSACKHLRSFAGTSKRMLASLQSSPSFHRLQWKVEASASHSSLLAIGEITGRREKAISSLFIILCPGFWNDAWIWDGTSEHAQNGCFLTQDLKLRTQVRISLGISLTTKREDFYFKVFTFLTLTPIGVFTPPPEPIY